MPWSDTLTDVASNNKIANTNVDLLSDLASTATESCDDTSNNGLQRNHQLSASERSI